MLETLRRGRRVGTAALVLLVGGVFVFFIAVGAPLQCGTTSAVVQVGEQAFYRDDFLRARAQQEAYYRDLLGQGFDAGTAASYLDASTAQVLVTQAILASEAGRLGLAVSKEELADFVRRDPSFRDGNGRFDQKLYLDFAEYEFGSERSFIEDLERRLLVQKMVRLLNASARVSDAEARDAARYRSEEIRIAFVEIDTAPSAEEAQISAEEVEAFLEGSEERVRQRYDGDSARFETPEQVRARHILIRVERDAEQEAVEGARRRAEEALQRIRDGADFADVALELSEDPGSRDQGGDLGFFPRGQMVPPVEEAAFRREPGALGDLVRSDFGFHVIRVEERREAKVRSFEEVREELARELIVEETGRERARERIDALQAALREGRSLEEAAQEQLVSIERSGWLRRRADGFVPGLGQAPALLDTAFALSEERPVSDRVFEAGSKLAMVELLERKEPSEAELSAAIDEERERLLDEKRRQLTDAWILARRKELEKQGAIVANLSALDQP